MIYNVDYFINKFAAIPEELWCTNTYSINDTYCALGHCGVTYVGIILKETKEADALADMFDNKLGHRVAFVNDGEIEKYQQPTPKQRILAALSDIKQLQAVKQAEDIINSPAQLQPC